MTRPTFPSARAAFTLLELLIVIGIIGILFGLLVPSMSRVRDTAKTAMCVSNQRQIFNAIQMYAEANENQLPSPSQIGDAPTGNGLLVCWAMDKVCVANFEVGTLWPYIAPTVEARKGVVWCPADSIETSRVGGNVASNERNFSYSFNRTINDDAGGWPKTIQLRRVLKPAEKIMMYEEFAPNDGICYGITDSDDWISGRHGGVNSTTSLAQASASDTQWRRIGKSNQLFFDGHTELVSVEKYFAPCPSLPGKMWGEYWHAPLTK